MIIIIIKSEVRDNEKRDKDISTESGDALSLTTNRYDIWINLVAKTVKYLECIKKRGGGWNKRKGRDCEFIVRGAIPASAVYLSDLIRLLSIAPKFQWLYALDKHTRWVRDVWNNDKGDPCHADSSEAKGGICPAQAGFTRCLTSTSTHRVIRSEAREPRRNVVVLALTQRSVEIILEPLWAQ